MVDIKTIFSALQKLLPSLMEVVIHDIKSNQIIYKEGDLTTRSVGDSSYLEKGDYKNIDDIIYIQTTNEGKIMRSISLPIFENEVIDKIICINCDISVFSEMQSLSSKLLESGISSRPEILFKNEYKEKINCWIANYLAEKNCQLSKLTFKEKKQMVRQLYINNAFEEKNAVKHIASALAIGRATIFKYLKEWKNK